MARPLKDSLNESNPSKMSNAMQQARAGDLMMSCAKYAVESVASNVMSLPEDAKAGALLAVHSNAGTTTGYFGVAAHHSTPATGNAAVDPEGNIEFAAADAVTEAEIWYVPAEGEVFEETIDVDGGGTEIGAFLQSRGGVILLEAESLAGTTTGEFSIVARDGSPATTEASLTADGLGVEFAAADAVTSARVRYLARPGTGEGVNDSLRDTLLADSAI